MDGFMIKQSTSVNSQLLKMGNEIDQRVELFVVIRVHQQLEHWLEGDIPNSCFCLLMGHAPTPTLPCASERGAKRKRLVANTWAQDSWRRQLPPVPDIKHLVKIVV